jgi:hypothetical protein
MVFSTPIPYIFTSVRSTDPAAYSATVVRHHEGKVSQEVEEVKTRGALEDVIERLFQRATKESWTDEYEVRVFIKDGA